jgi:hypothetical protein
MMSGIQQSVLRIADLSSCESIAFSDADVDIAQVWVQKGAAER